MNRSARALIWSVEAMRAVPVEAPDEALVASPETGPPPIVRKRNRERKRSLGGRQARGYAPSREAGSRAASRKGCATRRKAGGLKAPARPRAARRQPSPAAVGGDPWPPAQKEREDLRKREERERKGKRATIL
ncbi:hypothetical protein AXF42_Ash001807 [Apostasia shenzhenica]|uniref:Uncharacterized protein n=1 Tax=Apostasia shenzhenica TaxID=1088818 RepID=A0A2I0ABE2_9ASPA|nr:hypothetical protein AXF42_Ash001807 [Apostasia shenzhenica]